MYRIIGADGREYGPISRETLLQWQREGRANAQSWVQTTGATGWQPLGTLPEFAEAGGGVPPTAGPLLGTPPVALAPIPTVRRANPMAVTSLVMGLLAITCGCCCCYGFPFNVLGILFGILAWMQINRAPAVESGRELAIAGLILSVLSLFFSVILSLFGMVAAWPDISCKIRRF